MRLVCFGDSNTRGYDPRSYLGSLYGSENRWVDILGAKTGFQVLNWGGKMAVKCLKPPFLSRRIRSCS